MEIDRLTQGAKAVEFRREDARSRYEMPRGNGPTDVEWMRIERMNERLAGDGGA